VLNLHRCVDATHWVVTCSAVTCNLSCVMTFKCIKSEQSVCLSAVLASSMFDLLMYSLKYHHIPTIYQEDAVCFEGSTSLSLVTIYIALQMCQSLGSVFFQQDSLSCCELRSESFALMRYAYLG